MNKREIRLSVPLLYGGISQQPENVRFPSQVSDALNFDFTVEQGATKRPGTTFVRKILPAPTFQRDIRIHAIQRDEKESYIIMYGDGNVRAFQVFGQYENGIVEGVVDTSAAASVYLSHGNANASDMVLVTVNDYTILVNKKMAVGLQSSSDYATPFIYKNYSEMISQIVSNDTYVKTLENDSLDNLGYYKYSSGNQTFAYANNKGEFHDSTWYNPNGAWDDDDKNPLGFRVGFQRLPMLITDGTTAVSGSNWTFTKTNAFSSYTFRSGDMIYFSGGTGVTVGWAKIISKDSASQITVSPTSAVLPATSTTDVDTNGIGIEAVVSENFTNSGGGAESTMEGIAKRLEKAMQKAGADNGLITWHENGGRGYFQIVSPYKGSGSVIRNVSNPNYVGTDTHINNLTTSTKPFHDFLAYSPVDGTGGTSTTTQSPSSRWTRVAAPLQNQAVLDSGKFPIKLVRKNSGNQSVNCSTLAGNPTTVQKANHGLITGQTIKFQTTLTGTFVVTVVDQNTFTVPVFTSVPYVTVSYQALAWFDCDTIAWNQRLSGDETNNPAPQPFIDNQQISDVAFVENRMCIAMGQYLVLSQADDVFNFYATTYNNIVDSDPIVAPLATNNVVNCKFIIPYRESILIWTYNGQHIEFSWEGTLTPTTIRTTQLVNAQSINVRPIRFGEFVYFISGREKYSEVNQYRYDDISAQNVFQSINSHVPSLVPVGIKSIVVVETEGAIVLHETDKSNLYVYRRHFTGNAQNQSAWTKYEIGGATTSIKSIDSIQNSIYLLVESSYSEYTIEAMVYSVQETY